MKGKHHDGENQSGGQHADTVGRAREQGRQPRHIAKYGDQERLDIFLQERRENEQAPDAVDDAGNAGEQFDSNTDRTPQPHRAKLGEKQRDQQADRHRDQHGDDRSDDGAVDRRDGAEFLGHRIPALYIQKAEPERVQSRPRAVHQGNDDAAEDDENGDGGGAGEMAERGIAKTQALQDLAAIRLLRNVDSRALIRNINHGSSPVRLHPALLEHSIAAQRSHSSGLAAAKQATHGQLLGRRWTRKGRHNGALSCCHRIRTRACRSRP